MKKLLLATLLICSIGIYMAYSDANPSNLGVETIINKIFNSTNDTFRALISGSARMDRVTADYVIVTTKLSVDSVSTFSGDVNIGINNVVITASTGAVNSKNTVTGNTVVVMTLLSVDNISAFSGTATFKSTLTCDTIQGNTFSTQMTRIMLGNALSADTNGVLSADILNIGWIGTPRVGTTETDYVGVPHTVTYTAASAWTDADRVNKGMIYVLDFDGTDDYLTITDAADLSFGDSNNDVAFTIGGWVQISNSGERWIITKYDQNAAGEAREWAVRITSGEAIRVNIFDESANVGCSTTTDTAMSVGWHHFCVTYDGRGGATAGAGILVYFDGVLAQSTPTNSGTYVAMENLVTPVFIGAVGNTDGTPTGFFMDDMGRLFIRRGIMMNSKEIFKIYQQERGYYGL